MHLWFSKSPSSLSSSLLQDLGYLVLSLHVIVQENMCHVALDYGEVREGASPKRVASPHVPQRSRGLQAPATVQHSRPLPLIRAWLGRFLHSSINSLLSPFPSAWLLLQHRPSACFLTTPGAWLNPQRSKHSSSLTKAA